MKYSVVIPAHNEAGNLGKLVLNIYNILEGVGKPFEIVIVNDNSTDNSIEVLESMGKKIKELRYINRTKDPGVGHTIREGIKNAKGEVIIGLDGDLSHDPQQIPRFVDKIEDCDVVCGSRYMAGGNADMNPSRILISNTFNTIFRMILGLPVKDFTCGFRAYRSKIFKDMRLESTGFGIYIEIPIKAHLLGYKLKEVPITHNKRGHGRSNLGYLKQGPEYLKVVFSAIWFRLYNLIR